MFVNIPVMNIIVIVWITLINNIITSLVEFKILLLHL